MEIVIAGECISLETEDETGFKVNVVRKVFEAYMAPGSVTEVLHIYIAEYAHHIKEQEDSVNAVVEENIEAPELDFEKGFKMIAYDKIKDSKTIILLYYIQLQTILD